MEIPHFSVITPVYGCQTCLYELYLRLKNTLESINSNFEIIFVDDSSPDGAWVTICELAQKDVRVKGINLSRNFGQHNAIRAGIDNCSGDWVIILDCDLQDQPEEIKKLYFKIQEGYDIVLGRRMNRDDKMIKKILSKFFFKVYNYFTEANIDRTIGNFCIYSRDVIESFKKLREKEKALILFINWLGYNVTTVDLEHSRRMKGKSSYTLNKMINLAINNIVSQSNKPLRLSIKFGFTISFLSLIYGIILIIRHYTQNVLLGWTSVMVSIFFIGGLLFANMGLIGLYIGKIFDETKDRPTYIIKTQTNF